MKLESASAIVVLSLAAVLASAAPAKSDAAAPLVERVLTQEEQEKLTPDEVLKEMARAAESQEKAL